MRLHQAQVRSFATPSGKHRNPFGKPPRKENKDPLHWKCAGDNAEEKMRAWALRYGSQSNGLPDWIEHWSRSKFYQVGVGLIAGTAAISVMDLHGLAPWVAGGFSAFYWTVGLRDISQHRQTVRRNFPFLGNVRYLFESIRPEIRQYFIQSDQDAQPFSREQRSIVYARAKNMDGTLPFGTQLDVYADHYEFATHSMWPEHVPDHAKRVTIGGPACLKPYSASLLNISAMSYGALSDNAILALNTGAKVGGFYHNTGEGGVSKFHAEPGADLVWNIGTGYFGCRNNETGGFSAEKFEETVKRLPQLRMIEVKLSQGAKPSHGGILPANKLSPAIAEARGVPMGQDCNSPPRHAAFDSPHSLLLFLQHLRELSGGLPVGFKLCVGHPSEVFALVRAMLDSGITPDFITVDGSEGGTGAAPPEFASSLGMPLVEALSLVHRTLVGAGVRGHVRIICSGKVLSGFSVVRNLALGADLCNSARAMMFALGCIQALKCNTNRCPTGVATQDPALMAGLVVEDKASRVANYHRKTVEAAMELVGAMGLQSPGEVDGRHIQVRVDGSRVMSYAEIFPPLEDGAFLRGTAPERLQRLWDATAPADHVPPHT